jgi:hypothetical protein
MVDLLESDLAANLVLVASFAAVALGTVMIAAGLKRQRKSARNRA